MRTTLALTMLAVLSLLVARGATQTSSSKLVPGPGCLVLGLRSAAAAIGFLSPGTGKNVSQCVVAFVARKFEGSGAGPDHR